eukprot:3373510-Amphidinium_carterae.1
MEGSCEFKHTCSHSNTGGTASASHSSAGNFRARVSCWIVVLLGLHAPQVPYVLKQYFDCILHPGLTFKETASGPRGLLSQGLQLINGFPRQLRTDRQTDRQTECSEPPLCCAVKGRQRQV